MHARGGLASGVDRGLIFACFSYLILVRRYHGARFGSSFAFVVTRCDCRQIGCGHILTQAFVEVLLSLFVVLVVRVGRGYFEGLDCTFLSGLLIARNLVCCRYQDVGTLFARRSGLATLTILTLRIH